MDEAYLWAAIRYVERNPVRAGLVSRAEAYRWSSAAFHCGIRDDSILTKDNEWIRSIAPGEEWSNWLSEPDEPEKMEILRRNVDKGLPCGSEEFIKRLSKQSGRCLEFVPRGRPRKGERKG